jgi:hypothetical protein
VAGRTFGLGWWFVASLVLTVGTAVALAHKDRVNRGVTWLLPRALGVLYVVGLAATVVVGAALLRNLSPTAFWIVAGIFGAGAVFNLLPVARPATQRPEPNPGLFIAILMMLMLTNLLAFRFVMW